MNERYQTVVFVRHAVAKHNFRGANLEDPSLFDPPLISSGKVSSLQAGESIRVWWKTTQGGEKIDLVLTSPLSRCLQTAALAFMPGDDYEAYTPFLCFENLREATGLHYPDQRRSKSVLMKHWPMVQFEDRMSECDNLWSEHNREDFRSLQSRITEFVKDLSRMKEENIVVVTHGVWIETLIRMYCPQVLSGGRRVYNLNAFAFRLFPMTDSNHPHVRLEFIQQIE